MTPDRWQVVRRHLEQLLTIDGSARRSYLDALDDPSLRDELADLLAQQEATDVAGPLSGAEAPLPSVIAGRYRVERLLGRGGMGEVYLAVDEQLKRRVAVKRLRLDRRAHDASLHRLLREAEASAPLVHPHIATVYDLIAVGEEAFLVEEYLDGMSLDQVLSTRQLTIDEVLTFTRQLLSAMSYAHDAGVVHCDLKPGNLMVARSGTLKVLDFGIAIVTSGAGWTDTGSTTRHVMCTPRYAPPEVLQGHTPSPAADVFAIGRIVEDCLSRLERQADASVERVLARLAREASAPRAGDRPADASEFSRRLEAALAAPRWPALTRAWSPALLRRAMIGLAGIGVLSLLVLSVLPRAREGPPPSTPASTGAPASPAVDIAALMSLAERAYLTGDVQQALTTAALVLEVQPGHADALALMQRVRNAAAEDAATARADADRAAAQGTDAYRQAVAALTRAHGLDAPTDIKASVVAFEDARRLFSTATASRTHTAADFLRLARAARNTDTSLQYALQGLRVDPRHAGLLQYVAGVRQSAERRARQARDDAERTGATSLVPFNEGDRLMRQAAAVQAPAEIPKALVLYAAAQHAFLAALEAGRDAQAQSAERERSIATALDAARAHIRAGNLDAADAQVNHVLALDAQHRIGLELRDGIRQSREERERTARERDAVAAYLQRSEAQSDPAQRLAILVEGLTRHPDNSDLQDAAARARASLPTQQVADGPRQPDDADAVLAALDRWVNAMNRLDATDVTRAYPGANIAAALNELKSQRLEVLSRGEPVVDGTTAALDCRIRHVVETKAGGNKLDEARSHRIRFVMADGRWVISAIE